MELSNNTIFSHDYLTILKWTPLAIKLPVTDSVQQGKNGKFQNVSKCTNHNF